MRIFVAVIGTILVFGLNSCHELETVAKSVLETSGEANGSKPLTNSEVVNGLKEALKVGANNSVKLTSIADGFWKNSRIKIPFPSEVQNVKDKAMQLGLSAQVEKFELTLNRAAEEATKQAVPIFVEAITDMSIADGFAILKGDKNAATNYLRNKTTAALIQKFKPVVSNATQKVELTKYWNPIISTYNKIPLVEKKDPDLNQYVTERAISGLFTMVEDEEKKIRDNPAARVSDILKRVFGSLEK